MLTLPCLQRAMAPACSNPKRRKTAQPGERWTLWVKGLDGDYDKLDGVDPLEDVHDLKGRYVAQENLGVRPSLVKLKLVKRGPGKPDAAEEEQAALLDDPSVKLHAAGLAPTTWLLAVYADKHAGACNGSSAPTPTQWKGGHARASRRMPSRRACGFACVL